MHCRTLFGSFATLAFFSLLAVACGDDSSSASNEEQPISSSDETVLSSSSNAAEEEQPGSSASNGAPVASLPDIPCADTLLIDGHYFEGTKVFYKCEDNKWSYVEEKDIPPGIEVPNFFAEYDKAIWKLNKCTADNEGAVQSAWEGNPKYGGMYYFRCESGSWVQGDISLTCDTAGAQVWDICRRYGSTNIFQAGMNPTSPEYVFVYAGNGVWEDFDGLAKMTKECTAENEDDMEKIVYGRDDNTLIVYYKCTGGAWTGIDELTFYNCADSASTSGTCSFEVDGKMVYYKYNDEEFLVNGKMVDSGWVKAGYDPELGLCPMYYSLSSSYNLPKLLDSSYYYCWAGQWEKVNLVPKQYTDPRKEWEVYDYCISQNYYRYHEDGSWAIETTDEFFDDINSSSFECNAETEGQQRIRMPDEDQPGVVLQCVAVDNGTIEYEEVIVEYIFNQSEKK